MKAPLMKVSALIGSAFAVKGLVEFGKEAVSLASDLGEVQNVVDTAFGSMAGKMEEFAQSSIEMYGISKLTAKRTGSTFMAMASGMGLALDNASDMAIGLTGLSADMASFYNVSQDVASTALKSIFTGETETLKQFGVVMTEANLQAFALQKGITKNIQKMSQAEKVQLRYNFVMEQTKLAQGDFAKTSDSWANQTRILAERWKEFSSTLGQTIIPALSSIAKILGGVTSRLQVFANTVKKVFGQTEKSSSGASKGVETVTDSTQELTDATKKQTKAADKMLGSYDNLEVISSNSAESAEDGVEDVSSLISSFDSVQESISDTSSKLEDFFNSFKNGNYYTVGATIANNVSDAISNIDWDSAYEKARNFGSGFAEFLNGLFDNHFISSISESLAGALNTATAGATSFAKTFDWTAFGLDLAEGMNRFFNKYDFKQLAEGINAFVRGWRKSLITYLQKTDWALVGEQIGEFIAEIDWTGMAWDLAVMAKAIVDALLKALVAAFSKAPLQTTIIGALAAIKWTGLGKKWATGISGAFSKAWKSIGGFNFDLADWGATNLTEKIAAAGSVISAGIAGWQLGNTIADYFEDELTWAWDMVADFFGSEGTGSLKVKVDPYEIYSTSLLNLNNELKTFNDNLNDNATIRSNTMDTYDDEANKIQVIADKYLDLRGKEMLTADEEKKLKQYRDDLVKYAPELAGVLDDEKASYDDVAGSIQGVIDNIKEKARVQAAQTSLDLVYGDLGEVEKKLRGISKEDKKRMDTTIKNTQSLFNQYNALKKQVDGQKAYVEQLESEDASIGEITKARERLNELEDKSAEALRGYTNSLNEREATCREYMDLLERQKQLETDADYYADIIAGVDKATTEIKKEMPKAGKEATTSTINNINSSIGNGGKKIGKSLGNSIKAGVSETGLSAIGVTLVDSIGNGIKKYKVPVKNEAKAFGTEVGAAILKGMDKAGIPSSVYEAMLKNGTLYSTLKTYGKGAIPGLASGGVLPANKPFLALLGDQKNGTNIEAPLDTIKQGVAEVLAQMGGSVGGNQDIVLNIDGNELFRWTVTKNTEYKKRYGKSAF